MANLQRLRDEGVVTIGGWKKNLPEDFFNGVTCMSCPTLELMASYRILRELCECPCIDDWGVVCAQKYSDHPALVAYGKVLGSTVFGR